MPDYILTRFKGVIQHCKRVKNVSYKTNKNYRFMLGPCPASAGHGTVDSALFSCWMLLDMLTSNAQHTKSVLSSVPWPPAAGDDRNCCRWKAISVFLLDCLSGSPAKTRNCCPATCAHLLAFRKVLPRIFKTSGSH